jgi:hypothetical protein
VTNSGTSFRRGMTQVFPRKRRGARRKARLTPIVARTRQPSPSSASHCSTVVERSAMKAVLKYISKNCGDGVCRDGEASPKAVGS